MNRSTLLRFALFSLVLVAAEGVADSAVVYPQQMSARDLLQTCAASKLTGLGRERRRYCDGFVSGVEEGARLLIGQSGLRPSVCAPANITARSLADTFVKYAAGHGSDLSRPAAGVVLDALSAAYPCAD